MSGVWEPAENGLRIRLRVQPRSARERIAGVHGTALKLCVTAPPVDGAANAAVVALLARVLDVPRHAITITGGTTARNKLVLVVAQHSEPLIARLEAALACVDKPKVGD